ncbi:MAG: hypothetical protein H0U78_04865 [Rickettsiaceae bacterium]|nr:hypothetical protein [Rickettsiaceae bacterium]
MNPFAISSMAVTSFSIILSISSAIYNAVKKYKEKKQENNHKNHRHEEELSYLEEHKEHKEHSHKHKDISKEGGELEHHNNDHHAEVDLSGNHEFSLEH